MNNPNSKVSTSPNEHLDPCTISNFLKQIKSQNHQENISRTTCTHQKTNNPPLNLQRCKIFTQKHLPTENWLVKHNKYSNFQKNEQEQALIWVNPRNPVQIHQDFYQKTHANHKIRQSNSNLSRKTLYKLRFGTMTIETKKKIRKKKWKLPKSKWNHKLIKNYSFTGKKKGSLKRKLPEELRKTILKEDRVERGKIFVKCEVDSFGIVK